MKTQARAYLQILGVIVTLAWHPPANHANQAQAGGPCYSIAAKYRSFGGPNGVLGKPIGAEVALADGARGRYQEFRGSVFGPHGVSASVKMPEHVGPLPTSAHPEHGREIPVESSVYWTATTCAHVVQGEIRALWLKLGGHRSALGYPVSDEIDTPDGRGRLSRFEHGEIWWYPDTGARVENQR